MCLCSLVMESSKIMACLGGLDGARQEQSKILPRNCFDIIYCFFLWADVRDVACYVDWRSVIYI